MNTFIILFLFIQTFKSSLQYSDFFNHWHCLGIKEKIDLSKPYKINVGELPLVTWEDKKYNRLITTINICKHMGSKLDNGKVTKNGCLKCQYHGLEFSYEDRFGETMEHEGKIFWSYRPIKSKPYSLPFYNNDNYETSLLEIDMDCSLIDSAYNTMDLRHPEFVHNKIVGFGSIIPPKNIKYYKYKDNYRVGMSFDYSANKLIKKINDNIVETKNFHMYIYPSFSWSKVTFDKKHLLIGVNLLPLGKKKTKWVISICHNYYKSGIGKEFMKALALTILSQDYYQMKNQYYDNELKKILMFEHVYTNEEPILELKNLFVDYKYPDVNQCVELYKHYKTANNFNNNNIQNDTENTGDI